MNWISARWRRGSPSPSLRTRWKGRPSPVWWINVSINGTTAGGATSYPVTILIKDYGDLKPGMNVSATIEGDRVPNALCIPVDAVNRGNTVTIPGPGAMNADNTAVADVSKLETREVTLGKSDGDFIEVTGGLEEGDTVLIPNQSSNMMAEMMGM